MLAYNFSNHGQLARSGAYEPMTKRVCVCGGGGKEREWVRGVAWRSELLSRSMIKLEVHQSNNAPVQLLLPFFLFSFFFCFLIIITVTKTPGSSAT